MNFKTIEWKNDKVILIDQRKLPLEEVYLEYEDYKSLADAIKVMVVRGAPAIGVAAAMGVALGALGIDAKSHEEFVQKMEKVCQTLIDARPTAVNLPWAVARMKKVYLSWNEDQQRQRRVEGEALPALPVEGATRAPMITQLKQVILKEALAIFDEDVELCKKIGEQGAKLIADGDTILTHCNAGALATAGQGTALSPIYEAIKQGKKVSVFSDETRPFLQGARLTSWELVKNGIEVTLISDVAAASLMRSGIIQKIIVGADRIVSNGDFANKIGTYSVALAAREHKIPFYVAAPFSTIDWQMKSGSEIPIEERPENEVTYFLNQKIAPDGVKVRNPAFDITPHELVTGIITEKGVATSPIDKNLKALYNIK